MQPATLIHDRHKAAGNDAKCNQAKAKAKAITTTAATTATAAAVWEK
jgi:hypothetical protein